MFPTAHLRHICVMAENGLCSGFSCSGPLHDEQCVAPRPSRLAGCSPERLPVLPSKPPLAFVSRSAPGTPVRGKSAAGRGGPSGGVGVGVPRGTDSTAELPGALATSLPHREHAREKYTDYCWPRLYACFGHAIRSKVRSRLASCLTSQWRPPPAAVRVAARVGRDHECAWPRECLRKQPACAFSRRTFVNVNVRSLGRRLQCSRRREPSEVTLALAPECAGADRTSTADEWAANAHAALHRCSLRFWPRGRRRRKPAASRPESQRSCATIMCNDHVLWLQLQS